VTGRVLANRAQGAAPVAGATVKLFHNELVNGAGVSVFVTEAVSNADGSFQFANVPFGYYLLRSGSDGLSYLAANSAAVKLDVWVP
jgi:Carboxypeptidase regulatory-like domain